MAKEIISTQAAPQAIGPYSQAIRQGNTVYLSGQIPLDPATMTLVDGGREQEIRQVFNNIQAVCRAAGGELSDIVRLTIYLTDLSDFSLVNQIMESVFQTPYPARAAIGVAELPKGAAVEMDAILVLDS